MFCEDGFLPGLYIDILIAVWAWQHLKQTQLDNLISCNVTIITFCTPSTFVSYVDVNDRKILVQIKVKSSRIMSMGCACCATICILIVWTYNHSANRCRMLLCTMLTISIILLNTHVHTQTHTHTHSFHGNRIQGLLWLVVCPRQLKMVSAAMQRWEINHLDNK